MPKTFEQEQRRQAITKLETLIRFANWINENVSFVTINEKQIVEFLEQDIFETDQETETFIKNKMRVFENFDIEKNIDSDEN